MESFYLLEEVLVGYFLSVKVLQKNTSLLYRLWCVILIFIYYKFGFKEINIAGSHDFNFVITCIVNVSTYMLVEKMYQRLFVGQLLFVCIVLFAVTQKLGTLWRNIHGKDVPLKYETGIEIADQLEVTGLFGYIFKYSSEVYHKLIKENAIEKAKYTKPVKEISIEIHDITLSKTVYPRLSKVYSWLEKKYSDVLSKKDFDQVEKTSNTHVLILKIVNTSEDYQCCFSKKDIEYDERKQFEDTYSARKHLELIVDNFTKSCVPFVIVCCLGLDDNGYISKKVGKLISEVPKNVLSELSNSKIEIVFVVDGDENTDLESVSFGIQYKLRAKWNSNPIYCKTFEKGDHIRLKRRIGLYLERQFEAAVVHVLQSSHGGGRPNGTIHTASYPNFSQINAFKEIISHFQHSSPDNCAMHELKVLLERSPDAKAYGIEDNRIMVFVADDKRISVVKNYLNKYLPDILDDTVFMIWESDLKVSKCVLQQGSKVVRPDSKFGTLGLFLKDAKGNIYFTTCSHVSGSNQTIFGEDKRVIGRSVFSKDTGPDLRYAELIDLSIVKVEDSVSQQCQFGLRSKENKHESGQILDEDSLHQEQNLKVYKWGAATSFTKGTYKGWIAKKGKQDRFDQNLHSIVPKSACMFEEGDSGSLVCFEATESPYLDTDSAGFIFVGKLISKNEFLPKVDGSDAHWYYCYHVSRIFEQQIPDIENIEACLEPNFATDAILIGQSIQV